MKRTLIATAIATIALATPVYAGSAGSGFVGLDYVYGSFTGGTNPANVRIKGGFYITDNIAAEVHVLTAGTTDGGIKVDQGLAGFIRGELPVSDSINVYGLLGYGSADVSGAATKSNSSVAYGAGMEFRLADNVGINVDYTQYFDANNQKLGGLAAGVTYKF